MGDRATVAVGLVLVAAGLWLGRPAGALAERPSTSVPVVERPSPGRLELAASTSARPLVDCRSGAAFAPAMAGIDVECEP